MFFYIPADGDKLPLIWQYVPQSAKHSTTTLITAACAVMLVLVNVMRRN